MQLQQIWADGYIPTRRTTIAAAWGSGGLMLVAASVALFDFTGAPVGVLPIPLLMAVGLPLTFHLVLATRGLGIGTGLTSDRVVALPVRWPLEAAFFVFFGAVVVLLIHRFLHPQANPAVINGRDVLWVHGRRVVLSIQEQHRRDASLQQYFATALAGMATRALLLNLVALRILDDPVRLAELRARMDAATADPDGAPRTRVVKPPRMR